MPIECRQSTQGGKGNRGMFFERDPDIVAAGLPTAQQNQDAGSSLQHYLLKNQADALINDAVVPIPQQKPLPPLRKPIPQDRRHAGPYGEVAELINPPIKTKLEALVHDFKETLYRSYWKKPLGTVPDSIPMLPDGMVIEKTTFGKPTPFHGRLYDIVMPKDPVPDKTPRSKEVGAQIDRKYCSPAFNPELTYGYLTNVDKLGRYARCCVSDDRNKIGTSHKGIVNTIQANFLDAKQPRVGHALSPNNNIREVPDGYSFGILKPPDNLPECLSFCELNQGLEFFKKCLKHLNTLRGYLSKRLLPTFFYKFYLELKFDDIGNTGWLPKCIVYKHCGIHLIRFDPKLIEPLLELWKAFDGSQILYKTFVGIINYKEMYPEIPRIPDVQPKCLDYSTTYKDMVKPGQLPGNRQMAGLPSGRYFDSDYPITPKRYIKADKICLPQESDVKSCLNPSVLTHFFVSHRDMYEVQDSETVKKVFGAAGEKFTDDKFKEVWKEAQKLHPQGWVCFETFRQTLEKYPYSKQ